MRNIKSVLAYDGSGYMGWQVQKGVRTVQDTVEKALSVILSHKARVIVSGRTDTGVHAFAQVINFKTESTIPLDGLIKGVNSILPEDVVFLSAEDAGPDFHARFMAKSKEYLYVMDTSEFRNPFLVRYVLQVGRYLDHLAMNEAAGYLIGEHDFASFQASGSSVKTTQRRIMKAEVARKGSKIYLLIKGSGFLRHMVRNIAGTLLLIGKGKLDPADMQQILMHKDRSFAGPTAPPQGLYLMGVEY